MPDIRPLPMTAIVYLAFEPTWLALSRAERGKWAEHAGGILARHPGVSFTWYDADALSGSFTDFAICSFTDIRAYHHLWEELRDTEIFTRPYARITNVTMGIENGYGDYEKSPGNA
ncbi:darcynin family protein [Roseibium litorale]|uniref:Darcynin 2 n=1 Tax=Roseibium litorale TaxID=2803841 RepID=A0ABR9CGS6_9HYPH|nr:darcynin family protein [Roseibium litorale]MBD8890071.1 Darcynin 2 [Roseibium litorale]